jgi:hypothetical protein
VNQRPTDPALLREEVLRTREEIVDTIAQLHGKVDRARRIPVAVIAAGSAGLLLVVVLLLRRR